MSPVHSRASLRFSLLLLVPLALAAAFKASLGPSWPRLPRLDAEVLQQQLGGLGLRPRSLAALPAWRSEGIALSALERYQLQPGVELQVQLVQVQRRADFQLAYISRPWTPERQGLQRSGRWVEQRCLLPTGAGVTAAQLGALVDRASQDPQTLLARVLGLQPNRSWRCLHVRLEAHTSPRQAEALWRRLLGARGALLRATHPR